MPALRGTEGESAVQCFVSAGTQEVLQTRQELPRARLLSHRQRAGSPLAMHGDVNASLGWEGRRPHAHIPISNLHVAKWVVFKDKHTKCFIMNLKSQRKDPEPQRTLAFITVNPHAIPLDTDCFSVSVINCYFLL